MAISQVVRFGNQISFAQTSGGALWHKFSFNNGESWGNECLVHPNGPPAAPVTGRVREGVSASNGPDNNWLFISFELENRQSWIARQQFGRGWDTRSTP